MLFPWDCNERRPATGSASETEPAERCQENGAFAESTLLSDAIRIGARAPLLLLVVGCWFFAAVFVIAMESNVRTEAMQVAVVRRTPDAVQKAWMLGALFAVSQLGAATALVLAGLRCERGRISDGALLFMFGMTIGFVGGAAGHAACEAALAPWP